MMMDNFDNKNDEEMQGLVQKRLKGKGSEVSHLERKPLDLEVIDYEYLNGLRGWGALAVYFLHFTEAFWTIENEPDVDQKEMGGSKNPPAWLDFMTNSPFGIIIGGNVAVSVFFVLSGFVLPL